MLYRGIKNTLDPPLSAEPCFLPSRPQFTGSMTGVGGAGVSGGREFESAGGHDRPRLTSARCRDCSCRCSTDAISACRFCAAAAFIADPSYAGFFGGGATIHLGPR